ncbi:MULTISPECIES: STAS domain-containing protein [Streptomyces]|uniref:STAS domain-containing protein n=1 Tax=Streptomyces TaxID=1883 RepID=UPI00278BC3C5|nr:STAS domain-containing protein [Streptomyces hydrogenans]
MDGEQGMPGSGPPPGRPARFRVDVRPAWGRETVVIAPFGELDHDTVEPLGTALEKNSGAARIVVDCAGLDFCDSTGLNLLLRARARAVGAGAELDLAGLRPPVDRMFEITGALRVFRVYADVREALATDAPAVHEPGRPVHEPGRPADGAGGARPGDPE